MTHAAIVRRELARLGLDVCDLAQIDGHCVMHLPGRDSRVAEDRTRERPASRGSRGAQTSVSSASSALVASSGDGTGVGDALARGCRRLRWISDQASRRPAEGHGSADRQAGAQRRDERLADGGDDLRGGVRRRRCRRRRASWRSRRGRRRGGGGGAGRSWRGRSSRPARPSWPRRTSRRPSGSSTARPRPRRPWCGRRRSSPRCSSATSPGPSRRPSARSRAAAARSRCGPSAATG